MAVRTTPKTPAATPPGVAGGGAADAAPALVPHGAHAGKPALPLHRPLILIGSRQRAHVHLISNSVSRVHAVIVNTDHGSYVRDLASRTGTIVNGRHIKESGVRHSDTIQVGNFQFKFSDPTGRGPLSAALRPPAAVLHVQSKQAPVDIAGRTVLIGQRDTCDIALRSTAVSTAHALVFELNGRHFVRDLGSRTGTYVNGRQIHQEALEVGDMIRVGETAIRYAAAAQAEASELLEEADTLAPAHEAEAQAPAAIPVSAVIPVEEPPVHEEFPNLEVTPEPEPLPVGETSATVDATEPIDSEAVWESAEQAAPPLPQPEPVPEPLAEVEATAHAGYDPEPPEPVAPAAADERVEVPPRPVKGRDNGMPAARADDSATFDDIFGPDLHASDHGSGRVQEALAQEPGRFAPADDLESAAAAADTLPPLPFEEAETPPTLPQSPEPQALEPEIDFEADSADSVAAAINDPFGPLTDLSLRLPDDPHPAASGEPRPSLLDEIHLPPLGPTQEQPADENVTEPPQAEPITPEPLPLDTIEPEPIAPQPAAEPVAEVHEPAAEPAAEPEVIHPLDVAEDVTPVSATAPDLAELAPSEEAPREPEPSAARDTFGVAEPTAPAPVESERPAAAAPETVATFEPVIPELAASGESEPPVELEPPAVHLEPTPVEPASIEPAPPGPAADTVSATMPADLDVGALELPAPVESAPPEAEAPAAPAVEEAAAPTEIPPEPPAPRKRGGRKVAAKKPALPPPAAPRKRRPWGKKAREAEAAAIAAAAAAGAASAEAAAGAAMTPEAAAESIPEIPEAVRLPAAEATAEPIVETAAEPLAQIEEARAGEPAPAPPADVSPEPAAFPEPPPASVAEVVEAAPASADAVSDVAAPVAETLEPTEPSPESALELGIPEAAVAGAGLADDVSMTASEASPETPAELPPSDPAFDAMIEEFVGPSTGPIVEQPAEPALDLASRQPAPDVSHEPPAQNEAPAHDEAPLRFTADEPAETQTSATASVPLEESPALDLAAAEQAESAPFSPVNEVPDADAAFPDAPRSDETAAEAPVDGLPPAGVAPVAEEPFAQAPAAEMPPAPAAPAEEEPAPALQPAPLFDPFMGMGRDIGSFIGGLPLDLGAPPPPPPAPQVVEPRAQPARNGFAEPSLASAHEEPSFTLPEPAVAEAGHLVEPPAPPPEISFETPPLEEFSPPPVGEGESVFDPISLQPEPPAAGQAGATTGANEFDLSLPDLTLPDLPDLTTEPAAPPGPPPVPGIPANTASATAVEGLLEPSALELTDLDLSPLEPQVEEPRAKGTPNKRRDDDQVDPLLFTEAEAPTLQMLPQVEPAPQPPAPPRGVAAKPPAPARARPPHAPPQSKYPAKPPPPARSSTPRRTPRAPFGAGAGDAGAGMAGGLTGLSGAAAPPAGKGPGTAAHAFDGLALPVREADVFSGLPLGTDDPVLGGSTATPLRKPGKRGPGDAPRRPKAAPDVAPLAPLDPLPPLPPVGKRGRGKPAAPRHDEATPEDLVAGLAAQEPAAPAADVPHAAPPADHGAGHGWGTPGMAPPRRRSGVGPWLVLMIVGLAGALPAIYFLGPKPKSEVVGSLQFDGLRDLSDDRRNQFVKEQREWLAQPRFRDQARELLLTKQSGVSPGFLGNDEQAVGEYMGIVEKTHVKDGTNSLTLPHRGTDREGDQARMDALITTLYTQNQPLQDAARSTQGKAGEGERQLQTLAADIERAKQRAAQLRAKADSVPALEKKLQALQAEDERLQRSAEDARREVIRLRAEPGRAQSRRDVPVPGGVVVSLASLLLVPAPAEGVIEAAPATRPAPDQADARLREWRAQLEQVEASIVAVRAKATERAPKTLAPRRPEASPSPAIRRMEQELALKQRFRNAAQGAGLAEDAARLDREIAALSARLAVGRELVAAGPGRSDDASLQKLIDERLAAAPGRDVEVHALPGEAVGAPAAGSGKDGALPVLEHESADLRAKIAAREAELAAAREKAAAPADAVALQDAAAQPARDAAPAPAPGDDQLRAELAAAQQREAEASASAVRSGEAVRQARLDLEDARKAAADVARATADWQKLESDRRDLVRRVESLKATLAASVVPVKPGADAVTVSAVGEDRRFLWMLVAGASIVAGCSLMMWVSAHGTQSLAIPDRENPFEAPVIGAAPPAGGDDDERPLAV